MANVPVPVLQGIPVPTSLQTYSCIVSNATVTMANTATGADTKAVVRLVNGGGNASPAGGTVPAGGLLKRVTVTARATNNATVLQLYRSPDAGVTLYPIASVMMPATTPSATVVPGYVDFGFSDSNPLRLEAGDDVWATSYTALSAGFAFDATVEAY